MGREKKKRGEGERERGGKGEKRGKKKEISLAEKQYAGGDVNCTESAKVP